MRVPGPGLLQGGAARGAARRLCDAGRKIKTGHEDDESHVLILEEGEAREIILVEKSAVPAVFAERISEDVSEKTAKEEYGGSGQCQVQPYRITLFRRRVHVMPPLLIMSAPSPAGKMGRGRFRGSFYAIIIARALSICKYFLLKNDKNIPTNT